jgi:hypothetical protein
MANPTNNERKLIDITFEIAMLMHDKEFRKSFAKKSREELAEWVAKQLKGCGFETIPMGSSWGYLRESPND